MRTLQCTPVIPKVFCTGTFLAIGASLSITAIVILTNGTPGINVITSSCILSGGIVLMGVGTLGFSICFGSFRQNAPLRAFCPPIVKSREVSLKNKASTHSESSESKSEKQETNLSPKISTAKSSPEILPTKIDSEEKEDKSESTSSEKEETKSIEESDVLYGNIDIIPTELFALIFSDVELADRLPIMLSCKRFSSILNENYYLKKLLEQILSKVHNLESNSKCSYSGDVSFSFKGIPQNLKMNLKIARRIISATNFSKKILDSLPTNASVVRKSTQLPLIIFAKEMAKMGTFDVALKAADGLIPESLLKKDVRQFSEYNKELIKALEIFSYLVKKLMENKKLDEARNLFSRIKSYLRIVNDDASRLDIENFLKAVLPSIISAAGAIGDLNFVRSFNNSNKSWAIAKEVLKAFKFQNEEFFKLINELPTHSLKLSIMNHFIRKGINKKQLLKQLNTTVEEFLIENFDGDKSHNYEKNARIAESYALLKNNQKAKFYINKAHNEILSFISKSNNSRNALEISLKLMRISIRYGFFKTAQDMLFEIENRNKFDTSMISEFYNRGLYLIAKAQVDRGDIQEAINFTREMNSYFQARLWLRIGDQLQKRINETKKLENAEEEGSFTKSG